MRKRVDLNQREIDIVAKQIGASIGDTSGVGFGFPDRVYGYRGETYLAEIKKKGKYKLTPDQEEFHKNWKGKKIHILQTTDDFLKMIGLNKNG